MDDALERAERHVLERPDLRRGRVGRRVDRGGVDEQVRDAPVDLDERERRLDGLAVGHVARVRADRAVREPLAEALRRLRRAVEDRDPHAARGQRDGELGPELPEPAGDDGDATGEIEQRVGHGAIVVPSAVRTPRSGGRSQLWARHTASQSSRTQPCPPGRSRTHRASGTTSGHASAGTTGRPTASRHAASLTSLPT